ncbi:MAG: vWA domain-containing protein [Succinivibrionaceae bacterium]
MLKKIVLLSLCTFFTSNAFTTESPLLIEGTKSLYKRVLTTPDCKIKESISDNGKNLPAFSRYYVYEEKDNNLRVGPDTTGKNSNKWLDKSCTIDWKIQTAVIFSNPADRNRAPVFVNKSDLMDIIDSDEPKKIAQPLYIKIRDGQYDAKLIAAEPEKYVDYKKNFYLLPILDFEESMFSDGNYVQALKIASVNLDNKKNNKIKESNNAVSKNDKSAIKSFKAAIVFVIDSSISMQPYLDRTRDGIKQIYETLKKESLDGNVSFGVIAFRSNVKKTPALEYNTKVFLEPNSVKNSVELSKKLAGLNQAKVSSALFDEDAYSGVHKALTVINWKNYGGRFIVLVTDAGAIEGKNSLSTTKLDSKELRLEAKQKGVALYALHLNTESGKKNNNVEKARQQYEDLTFNHILQKPLYYQVEGGSVEEFGRMTEQLAQSVVSQVRESLLGNLSAGSALAEEHSDKPKNPTEQIKEDAKQLGYAMQLAYLGSIQDTKAPSFYEGWIADKDLLLHNKPVAEPVVLLTKMQLSDLRDVTAKILDAASQGILSSDNMFSQLKSIAASLGRNPDSLGQSKSVKLAELGLLGEYLDGLPYKTRIQELDEDSWSAMGPDEQNRLIEDLENKLNYYQVCNDDVDRWVVLTEGSDVSEAVYPIPLEALP